MLFEAIGYEFTSSRFGSRPLQIYYIVGTISIGTLANLLNQAIDIDRYPCKPITLSNRYRSISSHTYRFNQYQQVLIGGDKKVLFERQHVGIHFQIVLAPKIPIDIHLRKHIGRTIRYCGYCPNPFVAYNTYRQTPKLSDCAPRQVQVSIPHNCRPIVGPIAYSIEYCPGYKKTERHTNRSL